MSAPTNEMKSRRSHAPSTHATRFTLVELLILMVCAAITFTLISQGLRWLGASFLLTAIAFRTSLVDFTVVGHLSVLLTMIFGTISITLLIFWSAGL